MLYSAYSEYVPTSTGAKYPKEWSIERLRFSVVSNPVKSEIANWDNDILVSFVPMEAVGEYGEMSLEKEKPIADVYGGYTYFADGDILIAKITPCFENGKGAIAEGLKNAVGFGTTEFHVLRPLKGISKRWLYYLTMSDSFRKSGTSEMLGAGGQKRVPETFIKDFRTGIPSFTAQEIIAEFLDWKTGQIDALISKKKQLIEKLNEKRVALITHAVTKGLNPNVPMRDSGIPWLGEVPKHWEVKRLKFLGKCIIGLTYDPAHLSDEQDGTLVLRSSNIQNGEIVLSDNVYVNSLIPDNLKTRNGDILICSRNGSRHLVGKTARISGISVGLSFGAFTTVFRGEYNDFLFYYFNSDLVAQQAGLFQTSTIYQLTTGILNEMWSAIPPVPEQKEIVDRLQKSIKQIDALIATNEQLIRRLIEYRIALITAATTGKIDVRNVEIGGTV